jgi:hypothetical protein
LGNASFVYKPLNVASFQFHNEDCSGYGLVILATRDSASASVNPTVIMDLYISCSRTAVFSRADKHSRPCKFSMVKKVSAATDKFDMPVFTVLEIPEDDFGGPNLSTKE